MDFDQYVAARYGRLIEHAVLLGCAEGEAGTYVDRVLLEQRKKIRRADDPDPLVHEALERAISGEPDRPRSTGPLVALGLVGVVLLVAVVLAWRPSSAPVPSLFGLDGQQAQRQLEEDGYDVVLRPARACEPQGLVLATEPSTGSPARGGSTITVHTAVTSGSACEAEYPSRSAAWAFVRFALGGPAPDFAQTVNVVVDRSASATLTQGDAADLDRWGGTLDLLVEAAHARTRTPSGMPSLLVSLGLPPDTWCGVPRPPEGGERHALRLEVDPRAPGDDTGCPLTVDLYRSSDGVIDSVVVYTAKGLDPDRASTD